MMISETESVLSYDFEAIYTADCSGGTFLKKVEKSFDFSLDKSGFMCYNVIR